MEWRGLFENGELNALHAECFEHRLLDDDWWGQVNGGVHAFVLDTMVARDAGLIRLK